MCGRYTLTTSLDILIEQFGLKMGPDDVSCRFNVAPTQFVPVIANNAPEQLQLFKWGLIPSWAKDPAIGNRMINARGETAAEKPSFRAPFKRKRCLVLADGFFEWKKTTEKLKQPYYIRLRSKKPFAFAGLWDHWQSPDGQEIYSCTIITTSPNDLVQSIHQRMPVILPQKSQQLWLGPTEDRRLLDPLLIPYSADEMEAYPVSRHVNSPRNDDAECIDPIE